MTKSEDLFSYPTGNSIFLEIRKFIEKNLRGTDIGIELRDICNKAMQNSQVLFLELKSGNVSQTIKNIQNMIAMTEMFLKKFSKVQGITWTMPKENLSSYIAWLTNVQSALKTLEKALNKPVY